MCGAEGPLCPCQVLCGGWFPLWGRGDRLLSCRTAGFRVRGRGDRSGKRDVAAGSADPGADGAIRSKGPFRRKASFSAESTPCCGASELFPSVMSL